MEPVNVPLDHLDSDHLDAGRDHDRSVGVERPRPSLVTSVLQFKSQAERFAEMYERTWDRGPPCDCG